MPEHGILNWNKVWQTKRLSTFLFQSYILQSKMRKRFIVGMATNVVVNVLYITFYSNKLSRVS